MFFDLHAGNPSRRGQSWLVKIKKCCLENDYTMHIGTLHDKATGIMPYLPITQDKTQLIVLYAHTTLLVHCQRVRVLMIWHDS